MHKESMCERQDSVTAAAATTLLPSIHHILTKCQLSNTPTDSQIIPPLQSSSQSSVTGSGKKILGKGKFEESNLMIEKDLMSRLIKQGEDNNALQTRCSEMMLTMNQQITLDTVTFTNMLCTDLACLHLSLLLSYKEVMYKLHNSFM